MNNLQKINTIKNSLKVYVIIKYQNKHIDVIDYYYKRCRSGDARTWLKTNYCYSYERIMDVLHNHCKLEFRDQYLRFFNNIIKLNKIFTIPQFLRPQYTAITAKDVVKNKFHDVKKYKHLFLLEINIPEALCSYLEQSDNSILKRTDYEFEDDKTFKGLFVQFLKEFNKPGGIDFNEYVDELYNKMINELGPVQECGDVIKIEEQEKITEYVEEE